MALPIFEPGGEIPLLTNGVYPGMASPAPSPIGLNRDQPSANNSFLPREASGIGIPPMTGDGMPALVMTPSTMLAGTSAMNAPAVSGRSGARALGDHKHPAFWVLAIVLVLGGVLHFSGSFRAGH